LPQAPPENTLGSNVRSKRGSVLQDRLIGGRYRIVRKIAEGGMGEVFEAQHNLSKKAVALKILFPHIGKDEAARQRFLREVSAPAQIGHDGIVEVYDAGFDPQDGALFVAMELLIGESMRDRMLKGGIGLDLLLDWYERILDPLAEAHAKGIVHRDLKPENIFLTKKRDGTEFLKILDFGIARDLDSSNANVTHTGIAMGTPHYMAPEQAMSAKGVSAGADVWAMGVMLYESLAGRPPFDGETASAIVVHACTQAHAPLSHVAPTVPRPLADFVDRCLQKNPQDRPANAGQMLAELRNVRQQIGSVPVMAAMSSPGGAYASTGVPNTGVPGGAFGTAALPSAPGFGQQNPSGYGHSPNPSPGYTPSPGAFSPSPHPGGGAYATGPFAGGPASGGAFGTPNPSQGAFGAPMSSGAGYGTQGGYGSPPSGGGAFPAPGGYAQAPKKSGGMAIGVIAVILIGGLLVVGAGIAGAAMLLSDDDDPRPQVTSANIQIQTDITGGELFVDNRTRGPIAPNQQVRIEQGAHLLEIRENNVVAASAQITVTAGQDSTVALNRQMQPGPGPGLGPTTLTNVQTFNGSLMPGDSTLQSGEYSDTYFFDWTAGMPVRVEVDSTEFDTYVILKAPSGQQRDNDDRGGGNLNAALDHTLNETGRWQVICTSFSSGSTGNYTLIVRTP
jgi:serine/threonine protein kinase